MNIKVTESDTTITIHTPKAVWEVQKNTRLTSKQRGGSGGHAVIEVLRLDTSKKFVWVRGCGSSRKAERPIAITNLYRTYGTIVGHPLSTPKPRTRSTEESAPGDGAGATSLRLFRLETFVLPRIEKKLDELLGLWSPKP